MQSVIKHWPIVLAIGIIISVGWTVYHMSHRHDAYTNGLWQNAWYRLMKNRITKISFSVIVFVTVSCLLTPWYIEVFHEIDYTVQDLTPNAQPPSWSYPFGTDTLGRNQLVRTCIGGRVSLAVGALAALVATIIGTIYGTISGYQGGKVDEIMMRFAEIIYTLPFMIMVIVLVAIFGQNFILLFIAIGAVSWVTHARIVRGQVLGLKQRNFILAAQALGTPSWKIMAKHIIPNVLGIVIVYTTLVMPEVMLAEAFLSFLGLGVQPPMPSWGSLAAEGAAVMDIAWWQLVFPATIMSSTLYALNYLGDGLRDAFDPKLQNTE